jgi:uncharacterized protein YggE
MKSRFALIVSVLLVGLVLSACGPAVASAPAAVQPPQRTINVSGTGQVTIKPDIAYINIGVHTETPSAADAVAQNNTSSQAVIDALKAAGVAADDLQTTNFNIYPNNVTGPDGKTTSTTYVVDNTVAVKVRDLTKLGAVLDAAVKAGANNVNSIQFDLVDKTKALSDARSAAVKAAKDEATQLAAAAGVTLGDIQTINYNENTPGPVFYAKGSSMAVSNASVPVSAGTMDISVNVTITYEIK